MGNKGFAFSRLIQRAATRMDAENKPSSCAKVPFDFFAHQPVQIKKLKTWAGCCFTVVAIILVLGSFASVVSNLLPPALETSEWLLFGEGCAFGLLISLCCLRLTTSLRLHLT